MPKAVTFYYKPSPEQNKLYNRLEIMFPLIQSSPEDSCKWATGTTVTVTLYGCGKQEKRDVTETIQIDNIKKYKEPYIYDENSPADFLTAVRNNMIPLQDILLHGSDPAFLQAGLCLQPYSGCVFTVVPEEQELSESPVTLKETQHENKLVQDVFSKMLTEINNNKLLLTLMIGGTGIAVTTAVVLGGGLLMIAALIPIPALIAILAVSSLIAFCAGCCYMDRTFNNSRISCFFTEAGNKVSQAYQGLGISGKP